MPDVIVIGGGLTGLSAAWELERLAFDYTLIEVKDRLGGSIRTTRERGFVLDAADFIIEKTQYWRFLDLLDLTEALVTLDQSNDGEQVLFKDGTETLIEALAARLTHPLMLRMAVSSVGRLENGRFALCLENGLILDARALVLAVPARYAERMLRTLQIEAAYRLSDYRYDSIARVSLGYPRALLEHIPTDPAADDYPITFWDVIDEPHRVPPEHVLLRAGIRLEVEDVVPRGLALEVAAGLRLPLNPTVQRVDYWPEADPLTPNWPDHAENMEIIERLLPPGVVLVGSDYNAQRFGQRVEQGRAAARAVTNWLRQP